MLRITTSQSVRGAQEYFDKSLRQPDYYTHGQEIVGAWHGIGAEKLQLSGEVTRHGFSRLLENRDPSTGKQLTPRMRDDRRPGTDFTFSAPKGVSLLYSLTGDVRIAEAMRRSVAATMADVEADAKTRVRKGAPNQDRDRETGNLVWAEFLHTTARPVDGVPDPHLHIHAYVPNLTFDPVEARWKALQLGDVKADGSYYEARFLSHLSGELRAMGYGIERQGRYWEVEDIPAGLRAQFSRRTAEIEAEATRRGVQDAGAKAGLGAKTRDRKREDLTVSELRDVWLSRIGPRDRLAFDQVVRGAQAGHGRERTVDAAEAVEHAVRHRFQNASVVTERELLATAMQRSFGEVSPTAIDRAAAQAPILRRRIGARVWASTREVLAEERFMLAFAREGRLSCKPLGSAAFEPEATYLNADQRAAICHVLTSRDRVMVIRGDAGVGKTSLMPDAVAGIRQGGHEVFLCAPTANAVEVLREKGFGEAETLQRLLIDTEMQKRVSGKVLIVDEAGLVSVPQMAWLMRIAEEGRCRIILQGDTKQHAAVERGDALRLLQTRAGIQPVEVREIVRQKGAYKDAVSAIAKGEVRAGFAKLDALGHVRELEGQARFDALATDYARVTQAGRSVLVVSPTHAEKDAVTAAIRAELVRQHRLGEAPQRVARLIDLRWSEAERADAGRYRPGQVAQFQQNAPGFRRGQRLTIVGRDADGEVQARDAQGRLHALPLALPSRFNVYRPEMLELRVGDLIRTTAGGTTIEGGRIDNNSCYRVTGFDRTGNLVLDRKRATLARDFAHLDHGYGSTSYGSQGTTVDTVLVAMGRQSVAATTREQFYVTVSRGQHAVRVYTDDKQALREVIVRSGARGSASELFGSEPPAPTVSATEPRAKVALHTSHEHGAHAHGTRPERMKHYAQAMAQLMRKRARAALMKEPDERLAGAELDSGMPQTTISRAERQGLIRAAAAASLDAQRTRESGKPRIQQLGPRPMDRGVTPMPKDAERRGWERDAKLGS